MKRIIRFLLGILPVAAYAGPTDLNIAVREDFYRSRVTDMSISQTARFDAYDSLVYYLELQGKVSEVIAADMDYARSHGILGNYLSALHLYEREKIRLDSLPLSDSTFREYRMRCLYELGKMTTNLGLYPQSVRYFFDVLEMSREQDPDYSVKACSNLALLFMNMKQDKQAWYYVDLARKTVQEVEKDGLVDRGALFVFYNNLAGLHYVSQYYDSALIALSTAKDYIEEEMDRAVWSYNIGNIYLGIGEIPLAKEYFRQVLAGMSDSVFFGYVHIVSIVNLAYLYGLEENHDRALAYYRKAFDLATKVGAKKLEATVYIEMAAIYKARKQYVQALELLEKGMALRDSLFSTDKVESINLLSQEYIQKERKMELEMLAQQLEYTKLSNRHKNIVLTILWFFLAIFGVSFCIALYNWYKQRKQAQEQAQDFRTMDRRHDREKEEKVKELTTMNLQLLQATEIIAECRSEVKKLRSYKAAESKGILQHLDEVLTSFNIDSAWEEFELYFRQIHSSFFTRLHEACPGLTRGEQRTCALLVLNFSVKEIAGITHRSVRTIEAAVYQIRKKMGIPAEVRTLAFLQGFLDEE